MMKKIIFGLFILTILILAGCGKVQEVENNISNNDSIQFIDVTEEIETNDNENVVEETEEEEPEEIEEEQTEYDLEDLVIEKNIGEYSFEDSNIISNKLVLNKNLDAYNAEYSFKNGNTLANVYVVPANNLNLFDFVDAMKENENIEFLDNEEFDFLEFDVFFNPSENSYIWVSKEKIILIENSVGFELLEEYLEDYPTSVVTGSYSGDDEINVEFEDDEEKIIIINDKQYVISITDYSESNNEITIKVNDEEEYIKDNDEAIIGNLLIDVKQIDFNREEVKIEIKKEITNVQSITLDHGESKLLVIDGKNVVIEVIGANSDTETIVVEVNGNVKNVELSETEEVDGYSVKLKNFFVNNIGEETLTAELEVWKE